MVAEWMLYFVLVSALLLGAGRLLEEAARRVGLPQRGIWALAMAASALLPLAARFRPTSAADGLGAAGAGGITLLDPVGAVAAGSSSAWGDLLARIPPLDPLLIGLWAGSSAVLLFFGLFSAVRLRRAMRAWTEAGGEGPRVLVSEATGPAVIGLFPGAIVLPRWATVGDPGLRRMMLAHEEEHLRARDPALLLAASALLVALPWNLPLWWQLRRLRLAVEVDCDARVLGRGSDLRAYATLLMEVGRRRAGLDPALLAFAEPASFLERRIRIMTRERRGRGWAAAAVLGAISVALVVGACRVDQPTEQIQPEPETATEEATPGVVPAGAQGDVPTTVVEAEAAPTGAQGAAEAAAGASETQPGFTPRDSEPELRNLTQFGRALEDAYPSALKNAGIGGRVILWVRIDEAGTVTNVQLNESSGRDELDQAAMQVMRDVAEFAPASNEGSPVAVWIALPVTFATAARETPAFTPRDMSRPAQTIELSPGALSPGEQLSERPAFTPRDKEPELQNRSEFGRTLERLYPPELRDAGVGGRALLWVFVDRDGQVANVRTYESSGYPQLDEAATQALRTARFSPAQNDGEAVPVWVALPVTFATEVQ